MPPRYSYWTILAGGLPTAFRATEREELLPTFNRIREKHPDAEMKWFARGRLWTSPEESRADLTSARARRDRDWRPGGEHRDPRQKFRDAKRERNASRRQDRFERKTATTQKPPRDRSRQSPKSSSRDRLPQGPASFRPDRPSQKPASSWRDRLPKGPASSRASSRPASSLPSSSRPDRFPKPHGRSGGRAHESREQDRKRRR